MIKWKNRKSSLRSRLTLTHVITAFISVVILMGIVRLTLVHEFEQYVENDQKRLIASLSLQAASCYDEKGNLLPTKALEQLGTLAMDRGIILQFRDNQDQIVWCMHCEYKEECLAMMNRLEQNTSELCHDTSSTYVEKEYPVIRNGQQAGIVVIGSYDPFYYTDSEADFLRKVELGFLISFIAATVCAVLMGFLASGILSRPIRSVVKQAENISRREYDKRVETNTNIVEVEELAESVNRLTGTLAHAEHTRKRMAGAYAHEFRTPLSSLELTLQAMTDGIWEPTTERLKSCEDEVERLIRMLLNIEKLVEAEDMAQEIHAVHFSLRELAVQTVSAYQIQAEEKMIDVKAEGEEGWLDADMDQMRQVITNLLINSLKYTDLNGTIRIRIQDEADEVLFFIEDNGIGISREDCPYIFDYLYRAEASRSRETGGSGIGLSIVKAIIEAHGGTIWVKSTPKEGTMFGFRLPKTRSLMLPTSHPR